MRDPLPSDIRYPFVELAPAIPDSVNQKENKMQFTVADSVPCIKETENISRRSIVEMLEQNIEQYSKMKKTITRQFIDNNINIEKYTSKLETAKQEFSKALYGKKVTKHKARMVGYLQQMEQIDQFVESLQRSITRILTPPEETDTVVEDGAVSV